MMFEGDNKNNLCYPCVFICVAMPSHIFSHQKVVFCSMEIAINNSCNNLFVVQPFTQNYICVFLNALFGC